jgi:heptosyltransferase II
MTQEKILIIGPSWVGDMIIAQSLFIVLKAERPLAQIDVLAPSWSQALLTRVPEVTTVWQMPLTHGEFGWRQRQQLGRKIKQAAYQQAILLPNSWKSALIPWFARIPQRTGWRGEMRYGLLNDLRLLDEQALTRIVERFVALGLPAGSALPAVLPYPMLTSYRAEQAKVLSKFGLQQDKPILALCPGAEYGPAKRWPAQHFATLAQQKQAQGWQVWLLGSAKDLPIADQIQQLTANQCQNLAGKTSLTEAIDLLALAEAVVANDSGLMHMACAVGSRVIALYGSTAPGFAPPLSKRAKALSLNLSCSPCRQRHCPLHHTACLRDLHVDLVLHAMDELSSENISC